jgi:hypothetical protein
LILINAGENADKYTSEAFFSDIKRRIRSIVPLLAEGVVAMASTLVPA